MSPQHADDIPGYRIERVLGTGDGVATLLARHLTLERQVVLKVLHPDVDNPSRRAALLEAGRLLASVRHRNLISVHAAQTSGPLSILDLEYLGPESLFACRGRPLPARDVVRLCRDLLGALEALHASGIAHRGVRATNVFRLGRRFVLADSLVAVRVGGGGPLDRGAARHDLRAAAVVLWEALTGRTWVEADHNPDWTRVPKKLRSVLARAITSAPERAWADAASLRIAFERAARRRPLGTPAWSGLAIVTAGVLVWGAWPRSSRPPYGSPGELAILPFRAVGDGAPESISQGPSQLLHLLLDGIPGFRLTGQREVLHWWERGGGEAVGGDKRQAARDLRVRYVGVGQAVRRGDSLRLALVLHDSFGTKISIPEVRGRENDLASLGETLAVRVLQAVAPQATRDPAVSTAVQGVGLEALKLFLQGEDAFQRDAYAEAEGRYRSALARDSTFALAEWRLANVLRWRREPFDLNLATLYQRRLAQLRPLDRLLIETLIEPDLHRRFELLEAVSGRYPDDAYAHLVYGEELFHRGPLAGRGMEESVRAMERAVARDSLLGLAYDHLIFAHIRQGHRDEARRIIAIRRRVPPSLSAEDLDVASLLGLAYDERFVPWRATLKRRYLGWRADAATLEKIGNVSRLGVIWLDIPASQLALSNLLLARPATPERRAGAHEGMGLALFALGRPAAAFARFDSAASLFDSPESRLQRAEWRLLPSALDLVPSTGDEARWRGRLEGLVTDSALGPRAAWALALARYVAGDTATARVWADRVTGRAAHPLRELLRALAEAARGRPGAALAITDSVRLPFKATRPPDAFASAAFHLLRGEWAAAMGDSLQADREWLWYEGSDVEGWPEGLAQAAEVSGALGVAARLMRGRLLLARARDPGDTTRACVLLRRVVELWADAEPEVRPLANEADSLARTCP